MEDTYSNRKSLYDYDWYGSMEEVSDEADEPVKKSCFKSWKCWLSLLVVLAGMVTGGYFLYKKRVFAKLFHKHSKNVTGGSVCKSDFDCSDSGQSCDVIAGICKSGKEGTSKEGQKCNPSDAAPALCPVGQICNTKSMTCEASGFHKRVCLDDKACDAGEHCDMGSYTCVDSSGRPGSSKGSTVDPSSAGKVPAIPAIDPSSAGKGVDPSSAGKGVDPSSDPKPAAPPRPECETDDDCVGRAKSVCGTATGKCMSETLCKSNADCSVDTTGDEDLRLCSAARENGRTYCISWGCADEVSSCNHLGKTSWGGPFVCGMPPIGKGKMPGSCTSNVYGIVPQGGACGIHAIQYYDACYFPMRCVLPQDSVQPFVLKTSLRGVDDLEATTRGVCAL